MGERSHHCGLGPDDVCFTLFVPQHVVFFVGRLIDMMVPDIPEEVEMKMKREHYMAKEALAENQVQQLRPKSSSVLFELDFLVALRLAGIFIFGCFVLPVFGENHDSG